MNGRALFTYNPDLFQDDANAGTEADYEMEGQGDTMMEETKGEENPKN